MKQKRRRKFGVWRIGETDLEKEPTRCLKVIIRMPMELSNLYDSVIAGIEYSIKAWEAQNA